MSQLVVTPHPLTLDGQRRIVALDLLPGESLARFLERHEVELSPDGWVVTISGAVVPPAMWHRTRPRPGQLIECRCRPGRDVLRAVAFAILVYYTAGAGATWAGSLGVTSALGSALVYAGAFMIGAAIINKVLPPSRARLTTYDNATGSTFSLTNSRNRSRPYEPLGLLFGTSKVVPDYSALPYSWFDGDEQYQALRFSAGINTKRLANKKIGTTLVANFEDVVETLAGFPTGNSEVVDWANVDTVAGAVLTAPTAPGAWVTRTTSAGTLRFAVDIVAQLYEMSNAGQMLQVSLTLNMEYRLVGALTWTPMSNIVITNTGTKPARRTVLTPDMPVGQYEVRLRKATADVATSRASNAVEWSSLKSYQQVAGLLGGYPQYALRVKASAQLNNTVDELSWVATARDTAVWNGTTFVVQETDNPGAHMLQFARGIYDDAGRLQAGMGLDDSQIDIDGLKAFMLHCAAMNYRFGHWFDQPLSCLDLLEAIAAAGLGSVSYHTGKLGVVWLAQGEPIAAVVNMGNIKARSFRVDYSTRELADELEISYFDSADDWKPKSLRMLAPGVTTPRETARYAPVGVPEETGAVRMGRVTMAQNVYQRKAVTWEMDLEAITFRRYSLVALSHDLTRWGQSGRVKAAVNVSGTVTLTLDEPVPANGTRYIGLRIPGEIGYRVFGVNAFAGAETRTVTLSTAWPGGVAVPGDSAGNPAHDTLWIYDFKAEPGQRLRVVSIEPSDGMAGATITAVPEPDAWWTYVNTGAYTKVTPPAGPGAVVAANIRVQQRRLDFNVANSTELNITFDVSGPFGYAEVWGAPTGDALLLLGTTTAPRFGPVLVGDDGFFTFEVRPFGTDKRKGVEATLDYNVTLGAPVGIGTTFLMLQQSAATFGFDDAGNPTPSSQTVTFTAVLNNLTGVATFVCTLYTAGGASLGTVTLGGAGTNVRTLTNAQFASLGAAAYAVVVATLGSVSDQKTVNRLITGPPAARPVPFGVSATSVSFGSDDSLAGVRLNPDGTIEQKDGFSAPWVAAGNWYTPTTPGIGSGFRVRTTLIGDALNTGTLQAWESLSTTRDWSLFQTGAVSFGAKVASLQHAIANLSSDVALTLNSSYLSAVKET